MGRDVVGERARRLEQAVQDAVVRAARLRPPRVPEHEDVRGAEGAVEGAQQQRGGLGQQVIFLGLLALLDFAVLIVGIVVGIALLDFDSDLEDLDHDPEDEFG